MASFELHFKGGFVNGLVWFQDVLPGQEEPQRWMEFHERLPGQSHVPCSSAVRTFLHRYEKLGLAHFHTFDVWEYEFRTVGFATLDQWCGGH